MKIINKPKQLTFKDLSNGDVFSCPGGGVNVWMKLPNISGYNSVCLNCPTWSQHGPNQIVNRLEAELVIS